MIVYKFRTGLVRLYCVHGSPVELAHRRYRPYRVKSVFSRIKYGIHCSRVTLKESTKYYKNLENILIFASLFIDIIVHVYLGGRETSRIWRDERTKSSFIH